MADDIKTGAPAPAAPSAPAPTVSTDTYGDKKVTLTNIPVVGYQKGGKFTPSTDQPKAPPAEEAPADTGESDATDQGGQPAPEPQAQPSVSVLKAKNGKTFKDATELLATYDASAPEAKRVADENKTFKLTIDDMSGKLTEANNTILKMQEYISNAAYAPVANEKYKGMPESEMLSLMSEDEKLDYKLDKREWSKRVESFKSQIAKAKEESESIARAIKTDVARIEQTMSQDKETYPEFDDVAPLREEILKESPHLANRPDSPYTTYYMAMGIISLKMKAEQTQLEAKSRQDAEQKARSAAAASGAGGPTGAGKSSTPPKDDGLRGLVKAGKSLKGAF